MFGFFPPCRCHRHSLQFVRGQHRILLCAVSSKSNVIQQAKAKLQDAVGPRIRPPHVGPSDPDAVVSDERSLVSDLKVIPDGSDRR